MKRLAALSIALWLGLQLGFGYVAAPILFSHLDKNTAGQLAGQLFHVSNGVGLWAWTLVWFEVRKTLSWTHSRSQKIISQWVFLLMILFVITEFAITPTIAALKAGEVRLLARLVSDSFGVWHGISSVFHLLQSLLGFVLMVKLLRLSSD